MYSSDNFQNKSKEELILELNQIKADYDTLKKSCGKIENEKTKIKNDLEKRKNELQTIHKLSSLLENNDLSLPEIVKKVVNIIPSGWQYPEITCAKITLGKEEYKTKNFNTSEWKQSESVLVDHQQTGTIEIYYLEQKPDKFEGPFLQEERSLLKVIAERVGKIATRKLLEEELVTIFRESPVAKCIIDLDRNYEIANVNDVFSRLTGYPREELLHKRPSTIGLFKDVKIIDKMLGDIHNQGFIKNLQYEYVTKDGKVKTTILNTKVISIYGRNLAVASFIDLTEILSLKKAEQEVNEFNQLLVESLPFGIEIIDETGNIIFANQVMNQLFGNNIIGEKCWLSHRVDQKPCSGCPLENSFEIGETYTLESEGIKGGFTMEISHTGFLYKGRKALLKLFTDITEKKKAERELIETKERLQGILDNLDDAYFRVDLSEKIIYVNPAAPILFGYASIEEMLGMPVIDLYAQKKDREKVYEELTKTGIINDRSYKAIRKDSSTFWISMNAKYIYDERGKVKGVQALIRDITKRKETEILLKKANEEIVKSEIRFKAISQQAMDGIALTDMKGRYVFVNQSFCKMTGYSGQELLNMTIYDLKAPDDRRNLMIDSLLQNQKKGSSLRSKLLRKDKSFVYVDLNGTVLNIGNDKMVLGVHRDVTELIRHEEELIKAKEKAEKNEHRYRKAQEIGHIGSWEYNLQNDTFWGSDEGKRIYNLDLNKKEFPAEDIMNCVIEEDRNRVNQALVDLITENKPYDIEFNIVPQNTDEQKVIHSIAEILRDENNNPVMVTGVLQDITLQKHFERELIHAKEKAEENETHLMESQELAKLGSWEFNVDNGIFTFTDNFYKIFKTSAEEIGGYQMTVKEYVERFVHPDDIQLVANKTKETIESEDPNHSKYIEHKIIYNDGSTGYIGVRVFIKKDSDGKTVKAFGVNQDITERKINEQVLIKSKEKAEESDRLKSAFLMNVSHEIRTPMNGILGFINLMKEPDLSEEERRSFIEIVNKSGERLLNTINDIVEISKIEIGDIKIVEEEINISELIQFHFNFFKLQANEKGIELRLTQLIEGTQAFIKADKQKLDGILMNLIKNAIKFTAKGTIEIGSYIESNKLYFYVSDSGKGIPQDKLESIFDRFIQVELGNTRGYEGSGIGLSIVKAYAEALKGDIQVKSELGKGSTFIFSIPYSPVVESQKVIRNNENEKAMKTKPTLLIAEDDEVNYYFLENILSKEFRLLRAKNGEKTVELFRDNPEVALILMDIKMPGDYDGFETTRKIREKNQMVPIIAQTAYAMESDKMKVLEAGCTDYISKPYSPNKLISLVKKYCGTKKVK